MNNEKAHVAVVTQPGMSSGFGRYIATALEEGGTEVDIVDALASKPYKLWPVIKSCRLSADAMWKARWENLLFSSRAWQRNSRRNAKLLSRILRPSSRILQVSKEYFPQPSCERDFDLYILYTMKLSLADGVTPWLPPEPDRVRFLELETELYQRAQRIFVGGGYVKSHLVAEYGVCDSKVHAVGGGVHPFYLEHMVESVKATWQNNLLFVGWDFGMKGGSDLLKAFELVRRQRPETRLTIVGPDPAQQRAQHGVDWVGPVRSREALIRHYRESDLFIMPSYRDSYGFVFLEAMTQGVPCIGSNLNAMPEIIAHGETGYIVPLRDPNALACAILEYYSKSGHRRIMGEAARRRVCDFFTWERVAATIKSYWPE